MVSCPCTSDPTRLGQALQLDWNDSVQWLTEYACFGFQTRVSQGSAKMDAPPPITPPPHQPRRRYNRGPANRFVATYPYPGDMAPPPDRLPPFRPSYLLLPVGQPWAEAWVLPQLWRAMAPPPPTPSALPSTPQRRMAARLWDTSSAMNNTQRVEAVLDTLGSCLYRRARLVMNPFTPGTPAEINPPRDAFTNPLADHTDNDLPACMLLDPALVRQQRHVNIDSTTGYTYLQLAAYNGSVVGESGHRFLMWALRGMPPPPLTWGEAEMMHICGNKRCHNVKHYAWGTAAQNNAHHRAGPPPGDQDPNNAMATPDANN